MTVYLVYGILLAIVAYLAAFAGVAYFTYPGVPLAMSGTVTWEVLIWLVGTVAAVVGFAFLVWWRIEGQVKEAEASAGNKASVAVAKADHVATQLQEHKLHVAETYIAEASHREETERVMGAISGVKSAIDAQSMRIDRILDELPHHRAPRQT